MLYKEIDKKTIFTIIPKPVHRFEIVLGKYFGMGLILVVEMVVLSLVWVLLLSWRGAPITPDIFKALVLIFFEILLMMAVALMFSSFSRPILTGILTLGVFVLGRVIYLVHEMLLARAGLFVDNPGLRPIGEVWVAVIPDLGVFDASQEVLLGIPIRWSYVLNAGGYCLSYNQPHADILPLVDDRLAALLAQTDERVLAGTLDLMSAYEEFKVDVARDHSPSVGWSLALGLGFLGWVAATFLFLIRLTSGELGAPLCWRRAWPWAATSAACAAIWLAGAALA